MGWRTDTWSGNVEDLRVVPVGLCDAGRVSLDIGKEDRDADGTEIFCKNAQRGGLPGPGCTCNQAVTVCHRGQHRNNMHSFGNRKRFSSIPH